MDFNVEVPLNSVSFGQCSINILNEFYKQGLEPCIFPISQVQLNCYGWLSDDFRSWIDSCIKKALSGYNRKNPCFKLWHLVGSHQQVSDRQVLLTFHESDTITPTECNVIKNNAQVLVTSKYTEEVFKKNCPDSNVERIPLGFDKNSFRKLDKQYFPPDVVSFGLAGKLEHRKRHLDIIKYWAKRYGNDRKFFLNCALFNQFLPIEQQSALIGQALEGKRYFNVNFNPFMDSNDAYNDYLNSNNIILGLSGAEGWGLPEFQSVGLGKHGLILGATGYLEWINDTNAVIIQPNGKTDMHDGVFFQKGGDFNQGQSFTWSEESFYEGIEKVLARYRQNSLNKEGLKLQNQFTWEKTSQIILSELEKLV